MSQRTLKTKLFPREKKQLEVSDESQSNMTITSPKMVVHHPHIHGLSRTIFKMVFKMVFTMYRECMVFTMYGLWEVEKVRGGESKYTKAEAKAQSRRNQTTQSINNYFNTHAGLCSICADYKIEDRSYNCVAQCYMTHKAINGD